MTSSTENFPDDRHAADGGVATSHTAWTRGRAIVSICLIVGGLLYLFAAFGLDRGDLAHPGPGLFPILIGGLAVVAGILGLLELRRATSWGLTRLRWWERSRGFSSAPWPSRSFSCPRLGTSFLHLRGCCGQLGRRAEGLVEGPPHRPGDRAGLLDHLPNGARGAIALLDH